MLDLVMKKKIKYHKTKMGFAAELRRRPTSIGDGHGHWKTFNSGRRWQGVERSNWAVSNQTINEDKQSKKKKTKKNSRRQQKPIIP